MIAGKDWIGKHERIMEKMKQKITVLLPHYNATKFLKTILYSLERLTTNDYKVIVCDNGSREPEIEKLRKLALNYTFDIIMRQQSIPGDISIGHGEALNVLLERIETPYGVFLESDAMFLKKGWDEIMMNELDSKTKIIGCPLTKNPLRPTDFPAFFATMFETRAFKELGIDMMPGDIYEGKDAGWQVREKFLKDGYGAKCLDMLNTRMYLHKGTPFGNILCAVGYWKGELMTSHFGRGSTSGEAKYKGLPKFIRKWKGNREIGKWLETCRGIVDNETD